MKVLMITPIFFPSLGGIEQHVFNLSKQLNQKNIETDVLTTKIGNAKSSEKIGLINVFRVNSGIKKQQELSVKGKNLVIPFFIKALQLYLKKKYDLIHVHDPFSLLSVLPLKLFKVPLILTVHGNWINCVKGRRFYENKICMDYPIERCTKCMNSNKTSMKLKRWILRSSAEQADKIIAVSSEVKNSIQLKKEKEISVIPNVSAFVKQKGINPFNSDKKIVLFLGSLIEEKGAKILLKTAKDINALFVFVFSYAEEKYFNEMKLFIEKNNLSNVIFFEKIPNEKVRKQFIPFSDVIVIPSLWPEPCSSIATEAMNSEKPVIASNAGGFTDLIEDNETGFLFEPGNEKELKEKLRIVLENKKFAEKISFNALKETENRLNWNKISDKTIEIYNKVVK